MSHARYIVGDTRDVTATLEDDSVDLILTSPPFLALRSYLPADHQDKHREIGSEPTPAEFVDTLLELAAEWRRVLAPHGSIAVELGDTYSGGGGLTGGRGDGRYGHNDAPSSNAQRGILPIKTGDAWPLPKSLALIPELFRIALVYGINPLTGQESPAGQWRARNVVRWVRPNPSPGALGDKYRPATSEMVVACVSDKRWFDLDAVRGPYSENSHPRTAKTVDQQDRTGKSADRDGNWSSLPERNNDGAGAPPLDWWNIPTHGYPGAHYATWPPELCRIPIESMCPRHVCTVCGQPRRRIVDVEQHVVTHGHFSNKDQPGNRTTAKADGENYKGRRQSADDVKEKPSHHQGFVRHATTTGWTDCNHGDNWRPGHVLDPFAGTGTTLAVATGHGRDATGIDLDPRNADLARQRVGMFLTVNETERSA